MLTLPDTATLLPQTHTLAGGTVYAYPSSSTDLVKLDLLYEAGSAYQPQPLCAAAANHLFTVASEDMDARQMAEFMDYRGIVIDRGADTLCCSTSFYFLRRYLDELLPVIHCLVNRPAFPPDHFDAFLHKRQQELLANRLKSREVARRLFYETLFGPNHPLGRYAVPDDALRLGRDTVMRFFHERFRLRSMIVSGNVDEHLIASLSPLADNVSQPRIDSLALSMPSPLPSAPVTVAIDGAVQTTLRVGRIVPAAIGWDTLDYARFMLLNTLLGGYFGSRLMGNLREDKGYTYGIQSCTQIYRGVIVFFIVTDVAAASAVAAEGEIRRELQRLCEEPVPEEELATVKTVLAGDFIRSVDGVFERSERLRGMLSSDVSETFTDNLREALLTTTPGHLLDLARRLLSPDAMLYCRAGAVG